MSLGGEDYVTVFAPSPDGAVAPVAGRASRPGAAIPPGCGPHGHSEEDT